MGLIMPVLAMSFSVVVRSLPQADARTDDSRSLLNLTTWLARDVSSTREDGFFVGASGPLGGCLATSLPSASINLAELHWRETLGTTRNFVVNYRFVSTAPGKGVIYRYSCLLGQAASSLKMTPEMNTVSSAGPLSPAPVQITLAPTTMDNGSPGNKGLQFVVLIYDDNGVQRELLSLDATTTNVVTALPLAPGAPNPDLNVPPVANDLSMTVVAGTSHTEPALPASDANGDVLFTTFPSGVPLGWNVYVTGISVEVTPDPLALPGVYAIDYTVTDPFGEVANARIFVTISAVALNLPPTATAANINGSKGQPVVANLVFSDPEGEILTPVLGPLPAGWTATVSGNQVTITPSATATGTSTIPYTVTDSAGGSATSQITVSVCTVSLVSITPASASVVVRSNGNLTSDIIVQIATNGACSALVLGFLPNASLVESTESFNASDSVMIRRNSPYAWTRPAAGVPRLVRLNVRQGANGPVELFTTLTTTR